MKGLNHNTGLIFFYREIGLHFASFLNKKFKKFNPNILTVLGFVIHMIPLLLFALYGKLGINVYSLAFVFGIQIALILDYTDGSYARLTDQVTVFGGRLDGITDSIKLFSIFGVLLFLFYSTEFKILISLVLISAFIKCMPSKTSRICSKRKNKKINFCFIRTLLGIPIGFTTPHICLYLSVWMFINNVYVLLILLIMGCYTFLKYLIK